MNTTNTINTVNSNTVNSNTVNTAAETPAKTNWMLGVAGVLFWSIVFFQFMFVWHDMVDEEFVNFVIYNALPLIGALAFFGIRKEQKEIAGNNEKGEQAQDANC